MELTIKDNEAGSITVSSSARRATLLKKSVKGKNTEVKVLSKDL
jgi:hypothetical protein